MFAVAAIATSAALTAGAGQSPNRAGPSSCTQFAARATGYQQRQVSAALANNPAGRCVAPGEIAWSHPTVIMKVPVAPDAYPGNCPTGGDFDTGWTCVYNYTSFNGTQLQFHDCCYYQDLQHYGGPEWQTLSYVNTGPPPPAAPSPPHRARTPATATCTAEQQARACQPGRAPGPDPRTRYPPASG
jgi:hypothetical protein